MFTISSEPQPNDGRLASLDAYRGLAMFLMVAEVLHFCHVSSFFPDGNRFWQFLCQHQSHVPWTGCTVHDLIQPSFTFMVGVALPFSLASRISRGQSTTRMSLHAFWRALMLVALGIFLRSLGRSQTYFTFEDTLTQIGLGYGFLFLLGRRPSRDWWIALVLILVGYWAAFALYPLPSPSAYENVGVDNDWSHLANGFAAHWNKNTNLAAGFDVWFLNLFPRESPFVYNSGGYQTLSFIPTLATMILGLIAGGLLQSDRSARAKVLTLFGWGCLGIVLGLVLQSLGLCPIVKRIWTPSWTMFSGGWCFLVLGLLYLILDVARLRRGAFPLVVIGMNSIAIYCMSWTLEGFVLDSFQTHLGPNVFLVAGKAYETLLSGSAIFLVFWLILFWMYRRKIFLRI